jgi:hypothetical protein
VQPLGVVPGGGQQWGGDLGAHAMDLEQAGVGQFDQRLEQHVQIADLFGQGGVAAGQLGHDQPAGTGDPEHRSSTETPRAMPAWRASRRISAARMKLSWPTYSPAG